MRHNNLLLRKIVTTVIFSSMIIVGVFMNQAKSVSAQDTETPTPTNTFTPTNTPVPPTSTPVPFGRPLVVIDGYTGPGKSIAPGKTFDVTINLSNHGLIQASNVVISFSSGDFIARGTGGVQAISFLNSGQASSISQQLTASDAVLGKTVAYMTVTISYTDTLGAVFTSDTSLAFNIKNVEATS